MDAIECKDLTRVAQRGREDRVLRDLNLRIPEGARVGLLGGNGAGKTTFFKLLLGLAPIARGTVSLFGRPVTDRRSREGVGYLPEQASCFDELSGREYLQLYARLEGIPRAEGTTAVEAALDRLGLSEAAATATRCYSKGMLQKLELARVLLRPRRLLLLDEPLSGLDVDAKLALEETIGELAATGVTMVISSHEPRIFDDLCTHFLLLRQGRLLSFGTKDELLPPRGWRLRLAATCPLPEPLRQGARSSADGHELDFPDREAALKALDGIDGVDGVLSFGPIETRADDLLREVSDHA